MDWMETEIMEGFQRLTCLSLEREPSVEILPGMVMAWCDTIRSGRSFNENDAPRFREAFRVLMKTRSAWPAPAHFLEAMPAPSLAQKRMTYESTSDHPKAQKSIDNIAKILKGQK